MKMGGRIKKAQSGETLVKKKETLSGSKYKYKSNDGNYSIKAKWSAGESSPDKVVKKRTLKGILSGAPKSETFKMKNIGGTPNYKKGGTVKAKGGKQMLKRADGSYSQRGLWDNIRAAKGSGKKPTAAMLKQEKKIKAKSK